MYFLLDFVYWWIAWQIPLLKLFSTINNIPISVKKYDFTLAFSKTACHVNLGAVKKRAVSSLYI